MNDRRISLRFDMMTDETKIEKLSQRDYAQLTKAVLLETVRKLDLYLNEASDDPKVIGQHLAAWYQGSVVVSGEVISYRWETLE